jgi:hypothetical protein
MSQPSESSYISFKSLFDSALQEYRNQTKINLAEHPLAKKLETCQSVDSIVAILQEQTQIFGGFKDDGKIMRFLGPIVDNLTSCTRSLITPFLATSSV